MLGPVMHSQTFIDGEWTKVSTALDPADIVTRFAHAKDKRLRATAAIMTIRDAKDSIAH